MEIEKQTENMMRERSDSESLNSMVRRDFIYASSVRNYMNNDPILDYYNSIKSTLKRDEMSQYMTDLCRKGVDYETKIYSSLSEYSKRHGLNYVDIEQYDYEHKYSMTMNALRERADIIVQPMLVSYSYPVYGVADIVIKRKYLYLIDHKKRLPRELSVSCSVHCRETDHGDDYCIVEIKRTVIQVDSEHNILNTNFQAFEGQAHIYSIALLDMLRILSIKYEGRCQSQYWPFAYIYVRGINGYTGYNYCPYIEVDHSAVHSKVISAVAWLQIVRKYSSSIVPGVHVLPNPHNKYDHPYRSIKLQCAQSIGDIAYLPRSNIKVRYALNSRGIYSIYSTDCTPNLVIDTIQSIENTVLNSNVVYSIQQILRVNQGIAAAHIPRIYLPEGIVMYNTHKDFCFIIDGEYREKIPYRCPYSIVYYYYDSYNTLPRIPSIYTLVDLREVLEYNAVAVPGMINYDLYFLVTALYNSNLISSTLTGDKYHDSYVLYEIYQLFSSYTIY